MQLLTGPIRIDGTNSVNEGYGVRRKHETDKGLPGARRAPGSRINRFERLSSQFLCLPRTLTVEEALESLPKATLSDLRKNTETGMKNK
jgi:hypothetical protein